MKLSAKLSVMFLALFVLIIFNSSSIYAAQTTTPYTFNILETDALNQSVNVNSSEFWITNLGPLDNANATQFENNGGFLSISLSWLTSVIVSLNSGLFCALTGCDMTGDINMSGNSIINVLDLNATRINATNITTENINVTKNSTIFLGGVPITASTNFQGQRVVTFGDAFINATGYFGDGGFLDNISFVNGTVLAIAFNGSTFLGGNFTGENFTGENFFGGNFFGIYDWSAQSPFLSFNGTFLTFNESKLNSSLENLNVTSLTLNGTTITDWSQVNFTVGNNTVNFITPSFTGIFSVVLNDTFNFEIAQIIVRPSNTGGIYRFAMYESPSGDVIDADLINHKGDWNIFKSFPIDSQISLNFSGVTVSKNFNVTIKYFSNFQSP